MSVGCAFRYPYVCLLPGMGEIGHVDPSFFVPVQFLDDTSNRLFLCNTWKWCWAMVVTMVCNNGMWQSMVCNNGIVAMACNNGYIAMVWC